MKLFISKYRLPLFLSRPDFFLEVAIVIPGKWQNQLNLDPRFYSVIGGLHKNLYPLGEKMYPEEQVVRGNVKTNKWYKLYNVTVYDSVLSDTFSVLKDILFSMSNGEKRRTKMACRLRIGQ